MVHFGERLRHERHPPWADKYVNYELLKEKLQDIRHVAPDAPPTVAEAKKHIFQGVFDDELKKVLAFYELKLQELKDLVEGLKASASEAEDAGEGAVLGVIKQMQSTTADVARLMNFVSLNMAGVRKSLKKYAKNVGLSPCLPGFLALRIEHPTEKGHIITQGTFLPMSIAFELDAMAEHDDLSSLASQLRELYGRLRARVWQEEAQPDLEDGIAAGVPGTPEVPSVQQPLLGETRAQRSSLLSRLATFYWSARVDEPDSSTLSTSPPSPQEAVLGMDKLLRSLEEAESKARRNARLVRPVNWSEAQAGILEPAPRDEDAVATPLGLWLNCINSGLYMANYNLVIPTLSALCHHINVDPTMVGLVIGCCDVTTIFGTMGYSIWTNTSYKWPLLASGVACLMGNLAYCLSYDVPALALLLFARLVTGLGSARTVNRRYIAMYVAKKDRTAASALFVSLSAVGMALGPLLALPLSRVPAMSFAGISFNSITMGGWVMTAAWLVFLAVGAAFFEDPLDRVRSFAPTKQEKEAPPEPLPLPLALREGSSKVPLEHAHSYATTVSTSDDEEEPEELVDEYWERLVHLWSSPFVATLCCIFLCFVLKLVQQAYIDGLSIFTEESFDWSASQCGIMLGVLGLSSPIVNQSVGRLSSRVSDRVITVASIVTTGVGAAMLMFGPFPKWNFFTAGVLVYMGTIVLEAVSMSLTSKVIDERLCKGMWNAGLLSTQAGTLGRLCGNLALSLCAGFTGTSSEADINALSRLLFGTCAGSMLLSLAYVASVYRRLLA